MIDGMTSLINIPKITQLSKMIDGITSLINIPNIPLLQNCPFPITGHPKQKSWLYAGYENGIKKNSAARLVSRLSIMCNFVKI